MAKTIKELTQDLLQAPSACKEVKEAAQNYLDAAGTEKEADAATAYVKELEADIMPIDGLISFAGSDMGAQVFGADDAKKILAHAEEIKASGFDKYYVDHTLGIWPQAAGGIPFNACEFQSKGDPITDLMEDMAAEGAA